MYRIGVIGAVTSTAVTLQALVAHDFEVVGVLGHEPSNSESVSGWFNLRELSNELSVPFEGFQRINEHKHIQWMLDKKPDIIFAIGFSQLLSSEWLAMPALGCIGFHPTNLPKGRGRAPLAWIVLSEREGAACFFLMGEGADDGPIFVKEPFFLSETDDARSTQRLILDATKVALDNWLPNLKAGVWNPVPQDESSASWFGKRSPVDGCINWQLPAQEIDLLIKASTHPHPGAYTFLKRQKMLIWESFAVYTLPIKGVVGRILLHDQSSGFLVQCGIGHLWIRVYSTEDGVVPKIGDKLGFDVEEEIYKLWQTIKSSQ